MIKSDKKLLKEIHGLALKMKKLNIDAENLDRFDMISPDEEKQIAGTLYAFIEECERLFVSSTLAIVNLGYIPDKILLSSRYDRILDFIRRDIQSEIDAYQTSDLIPDDYDKMENKIRELQNIEKSLTNIIGDLKTNLPIRCGIITSHAGAIVQ